jgi:hypothetical protein
MNLLVLRSAPRAVSVHKTYAPLGSGDFPLITGSGYLSLGKEKRSPETSFEAKFPT